MTSLACPPSDPVSLSTHLHRVVSGRAALWGGARHPSDSILTYLTQPPALLTYLCATPCDGSARTAWFRHAPTRAVLGLSARPYERVTLGWVARRGRNPEPLVGQHLDERLAEALLFTPPAGLVWLGRAPHPDLLLVEPHPCPWEVASRG